MNSRWVVLFLCFLGTTAPGQERTKGGPGDHASAVESRFLSNLRQVTATGQSGEGYFAPDGGQIIFQSIRGDHPFYQIYLKDLRTGEERLVSTGEGRTTCSYFHPMRPRILYASSHLDPGREQTARAERDRLAQEAKNPTRRRSYSWSFDEYMDIFEADPDGSHLVRLTDAPGYDAEGSYSPDGKQIVFCSFRSGGNGDIFVMDADGSNVRQLTDSPGYDGGPFFSPDGGRIIFRGEVRKRHYLQIFVINADGTGERQLTHNDAVNWGPYWHPDGRHVIFSTSLHGHHNYELYLLDVEGGRLERVTSSPAEAVEAGAAADVLPVFDASGKRLLWTSKRGKNDAGQYSSQLWMADWIHPSTPASAP